MTPPPELPVIVYNKQAAKEMALLSKSRPKDYQRAMALLAEAQVHPLKGSGSPEQLRHYEKATYSRRLTSKDRIVYRYDELDGVEVLLVLQCLGHYHDK